MSYKLSTDYEKLYEKVNNGMEIAAFVDYSFSNDDEDVCRDICSVKKRMHFDIQISARGITYDAIYPFNEGEGGEKEHFIRKCDRMNLEWIEPCG